ncbi:RNA polymerase sigma factor [Dactylosporangium sp. NPDC051541]|uniref:RNA polymerase sigma factor n=1 Tax=Dactylosporangium sp. NPDC051541 TaxID=3363977 RepID=UPI0037B30935
MTPPAAGDDEQQRPVSPASNTAWRLLANHWRAERAAPPPLELLDTPDHDRHDGVAALVDVRAALARLPEGDQEILRLIAWEQLPVRAAVMRRDDSGWEIAPLRRRPVLAVAAVALTCLLVIVGVAILARPDPDAKPTPAKSPTHSGPTNCVTELADHVRKAPYDGADGEYFYQRVRRVTGVGIALGGPGNPFARADFTIDEQSWTNRDSVRFQVNDRGPVTYADDASRDYFTAHPEIIPPAHDEQEIGRVARPRQDIETIGGLFSTSAKNINGTLLSTRLDYYNSLNRNQALIGVGARQEFLRYLEARPDVTCGGITQTEAGPGLLITAQPGDSYNPSAQPTRSVTAAIAVVLDMRTGELIAHGTVPGQWDTLYLQRNMVNAK